MELSVEKKHFELELLRGWKLQMTDSTDAHLKKNLLLTTEERKRNESALLLYNSVHVLFDPSELKNVHGHRADIMLAVVKSEILIIFRSKNGVS